MRAVVLLSVLLILVSALKQEEHDALQELWNALNGPNWIRGSNWNFTDPNYCNYKQVYCDENEQVYILDLSSNRLSSVLPATSTAWNFSNMQYLNFESNTISGSFSDAMARGMPQLSIVGFSYNYLTGGIPDSFGNLTAMNTFYVQNNFLNGIVTPLLSQWVHLQNLDLGSNQVLRGNLPDFSGALGLQRISIYLTTIGGTAFEMHNLTSLDYLYLGYSQVTGPIPDSINQATSLTIINFNLCSVTSMPKSMSNLKKLQIFTATISKLEGPITPDIGECTSLIQIDLDNNHLSGEIPDLRNLTSLQSLVLSGNELEGGLPAYLSDHAVLVQISLGNNRLSGTLPQWTNMSQLSFIQLGSNFITGEIPQSVLNLPNLGTLDLSNNQLTGSAVFPNITNSILSSVDYSGNSLTGAIESLSSFTSIQNLSLSYNDFGGSIPDMPVDLTNLYMVGNSLQGNINISFSRLTSLVALDLSYNNLSGEVPNLFGGMKVLKTLRLSGNKLTGNIPDFSRNNLLVELSMSDNKFHGTVPFGLGYCTNLVRLNLANNNLYGTFPPLFGSVQMAVMDLSNNQFTGDLTFIRYMFNILSLDLSNNLFNGSIFDGQWVSPSNEVLTYLDISNNKFSAKIFWQLPSSIIFFNASHNLFVDSQAPDNIFSGIRTWPYMTDCYIDSNNLGGFLLNIFTVDRMPSLQRLSLANNMLYSSIPSSISQLSGLQTLDLSGNQLIGSIPMFLGSLQYLTVLNLGNNHLSSRDISFVTSLLLLQTLNVSDNNITATIPTQIGQLKSLVSLDLSDNNMYGSIPESMYNIRTINRLMLQNNNLTGNVSVMLSDPVQIDLSNNGFSGSARVITGLSSVAYLNISHNQFSGVLPDLSQKIKLHTIDVSSNTLSGPLSSFDDLYNLVTFNISNNNMSGSLPPLSSLSSLETIDLSNNNFTDNLSIGTITLSENGTNSSVQCDMTGNAFQCPVTWQSYYLCGARCDVSNAQEIANVSLRLEGNITSFDVDNFLSVLAATVNITKSRLSVFSIRSGSVIVDLIVGPAPSNSPNEGNAQRTVSQIETVAAGIKAFGAYTVLNYGAVTPTTSTYEYSGNLVNTNKLESTPVGLIIGVAVGAAVLLGIILLVGLFLYRKRNERRGMYDRQLAMIDMSQVNLGEAKNSIVPYSELQDMEEVGSGAYGIVYRAEWRNLSVAVKQIRAEHVTQKQLNEFMSEMSILRRLRAHPNVVLFIGVTFPPDPLSMITEFCDGGSLLDHMSMNQVGQDMKNKFIHDIALGMLHLHREGVIHRDLAARNILLSKHLDAKVSDFGMSRQTEAEDSQGTTQATVGPLKWMAPEAISQSQYSKATDSFSFGVVMWEIITEQEPWAGMTSVEVAIGVVTEGKRLPLPNTLQWLQHLIATCWSSNPEERPTFENMCNVIGTEAGLITEYKSRIVSSSPKNSGTSTSAGDKSAASLEKDAKNSKTEVEQRDDSTTYQAVMMSNININEIKRRQDTKQSPV